MQIDPQAKDVQTAHVTELVQYDSWDDVWNQAERGSRGFFYNEQTGQPKPFYQEWQASGWTTKITMATTYGVGKDNPANSYSLTGQQTMRAVYAMFEDVSEFRIRYAIMRCCTTGRNFLLGGYSNITYPLCDFPSPPPPPLIPPPSPFYPTPCNESAFEEYSLLLTSYFSLLTSCF